MVVGCVLSPDGRVGPVPPAVSAACWVDLPATGRFRLDPKEETTERFTVPLIEDQTKQIIEILSDCAAKCSACAQDCANQGDKDLAKCIALCSDCAEICNTGISLMTRNSALTAEMCRLCAEACDRCAEECERTGMTECAEACRAAAEACRQMAG